MNVQLRFADLRVRGIVNNWVTLSAWIRDRGFPPGRLIGHTRLFDEGEVTAWLAS